MCLRQSWSPPPWHLEIEAYISGGSEGAVAVGRQGGPSSPGRLVPYVDGGADDLQSE